MIKTVDFLKNIKDINLIQAVDLKYKINDIESNFYDIDDIELFNEIILLIHKIKKKIEITILENSI